MDGSSGDLETKYNKIATEYAKLRAQASVLKKAVVEEQSRNSSLQDVLREREQNFRKTSQEIDSLTFRNQQLTKRVTVLQNELDASENRLKKGKSKIPDNHSYVDSTITMHVLDEELQKKILENAELVSRMHDEESAHRQELAALQSQIEQLKYELKQCAKVNNKIEGKSNVGKLELEVLPNTIVGKQISLQDHQQISSLKAFELHAQSDSNVAVNHFPFVNNFESINNSVSCNKPQLPWMISDMSSHVSILITGVTHYHTLMEQRLNHLVTNISPVNHKLSSFLKESSAYLQSIQIGFNELQRAGLESEDGLLQPGLQNLSDSLSSYTSFSMKVLPYQLLSMEEENATLPNKELVSSNMLVAFQINCVTNSFIKLSECIKVLCSESVVLKKHSNSSPCKTVPLLSDALIILAKSIKDLASAYEVKCHKEQQISAFSEEVRKTNESIVNTLSSMVDATEKVCNIVSGDQMRSWKLSRLIVPTIGMQDYQNDEWTHLLDQNEVSEQIVMNQKRMVLLEQEKEHWHVEYQLLQLKHSKRTQELEEQLQKYQSSSVSQNASGNQLQQEKREAPCTVTNLLGHLEMPLVMSAEVEAHEQEVKNYLTSRIDHLVATCQEAETKAVAYRAECAVLRKRLDHSISSRMQCECRLSDSLKQVMKLQEELQTTTHNYEAQLSIMSEHLANMNEKLTLQTDEIDQLKYQLNNKTSHKRKQK